jgi:hypothetical protein
MVVVSQTIDKTYTADRSGHCQTPQTRVNLTMARVVQDLARGHIDFDRAVEPRAGRARTSAAQAEPCIVLPHSGRQAAV